MKKYRHLTVKNDDPERLASLLDSMKSGQNKVFRLLKTETANYAKNIFLPQEKVACFKTDRKSLYESKVWLYIGKEGLVVANITSETNRRLGITDYNHILLAFFTEVVRPYIDGFDCELTGEDVAFSEILPTAVFQKLNIWQISCNKSDPIGHPLDREKWMDFIAAYFDQCNEVITSSDLQQWLSEDCEWPSGYNDSIQEIGVFFEYSIDLLSAFHEYKNK